MDRQVKFDAVSVLQGAHVLVVEDDFLLLMELQSILHDAGAEFTGCRTVQEALAATKNGIAAAILDVRVGRQTIAPVARQLAARGTPFIFYTGQVENDPDLAEWSGSTVLSKPAQAGTIVAALADVMQRH
jgi:DNA-binding response OmpR family regulator